MKRLADLLAVSVLALSAVYGLWLETMVSSTTIKLGDTGYAVAYRMAWAWGMEERVDVFRLDNPTVGQPGDWLDIWKRPFSSGMALYRSEDGKTFIFGFRPGLYRFDASTGRMDYHCSTGEIVSHTALGASIAAMTAYQRMASSSSRKDHAYQNFVEPSANDEHPSIPPASRYYEGLRFLGMFGVTDGGRGAVRGGPTAFASSADIREPMNPLDGDCKWSSFVRNLKDL